MVSLALRLRPTANASRLDMSGMPVVEGATASVTPTFKLTGGMLDHCANEL